MLPNGLAALGSETTQPRTNTNSYNQGNVDRVTEAEGAPCLSYSLDDAPVRSVITLWFGLGHSDRCLSAIWGEGEVIGRNMGCRERFAPLAERASPLRFD